MNARDVFALCVRVTGLWLVIWGAWYGIGALHTLYPYQSPTLGYNASEEHTAMDYASVAVPAVVFGIYCLSGAKHLVRFAYPEHDPVDAQIDE